MQFRRVLEVRVQQWVRVQVPSTALKSPVYLSVDSISDFFCFVYTHIHMNLILCSFPLPTVLATAACLSPTTFYRFFQTRLLFLN